MIVSTKKFLLTVVSVIVVFIVIFAAIDKKRMNEYRSQIETGNKSGSANDSEQQSPFVTIERKETISPDTNKMLSQETYVNKNSAEYYEFDNRMGVYIEGPEDYRRGYAIGGDSSNINANGESGYFISVQVSDIVYHGLGDTFGNICDYCGLRGTPDTVGWPGDHGMKGKYYTRFTHRVSELFGVLDESDPRCALMFSTSHELYFNRDDYCYGAMGSFERLFDYEKVMGYCEVQSLASALGAKNTYFITSWNEDNYVPDNLRSNSLFAIETDIQTSRGIQSCLILVDANSEKDFVSKDTWVEILVM